MKVKYKGPKNTLRLCDRALDVGEIISEPADLVKALSSHPSFELVASSKVSEPAPKQSKKQKKPAEEPNAEETSKE